MMKEIILYWRNERSFCRTKNHERQSESHRENMEREKDTGPGNITVEQLYVLLYIGILNIANILNKYMTQDTPQKIYESQSS